MRKRTDVRIGLIARCEIARGIAIQSKNFYDHIPVDRVLLVRMPRPDSIEDPSWYPNRTDIAFEQRTNTLDETTVRNWLKGLDVVFTVETVYDWRLPIWCREAKVKLVIQGNPEFVKHGQFRFENLPHPDQWWWPTSWRLDKVPAGPVMPVPMDRVPMRHIESDRLRVLHVVGKRAFADRNGTDTLTQAMRSVRGKFILSCNGIDGQLPEFRRVPNVEFKIQPHAVDDRWSMYMNQDVLVLPRRYGGLCLPALEAAACGVAVLMPETSPNDELASLFVPVGRTRPVMLACGKVDMIDVNAVQLAEVLSRLAYNKESLIDAKVRQAGLLPTWQVWYDRYMKAFRDLL